MRRIYEQYLLLVCILSDRMKDTGSIICISFFLKRISGTLAVLLSFTVYCMKLNTVCEMYRRAPFKNK